MAATAVVVTSSTPEAPLAAVPVTEAPDTGSALRAARAQGTEVEAVSMRTSTREVFALPDGKLQARLSAAPTRVQKNGKWHAADPALVQDGGRVAPKATDAGVAFSGGGESEPLVQLSKGGSTFALSWPGKLPAPRLDGATATYDEVLPGVDLRMTAANDGYQLLLVVKSREAAAHVATVKLGMKAEGLTVKPGADGAFSLVDAEGKTVFEVPRSLMWDSKKQADTETPRTDFGAVGVQHSEGALTLVPDQKLLNDPATVYPVHIDPDGRVVHKNGWTTVYDNGTDAMRNGTHWNGANSQAEDKWWVIVNPTARSGRAPQTSPTLITRSYFQFDTSFLSGTTIFGARMDATVVHASTACGVKRWHDLHVAGWDIGPGTNWNNQPADHGVLAAAEVPTVQGNCSGHQSFSWTSPNFKNHLDTGGNSTYGIWPASDGEDYWRKFDPGAMKLVIDYNTTPSVPWDPSTEPNTVACTHCEGMPWIGDSSIRLKAGVGDPDGEQVQSIWHVYDDVVPGDPAKTNKREIWGGVVGSNSWASQDVSLTGVEDGRLVTWFVAAHDGRATSGFKQGPKQFRVDRTAPANKPDVTSAVYPEDNRWHGGTTVKGNFTFKANDPDVDWFDYGWVDGDWTPVAADRLGGSITVALTPPGDGPRDLFVRSRDRAGNAGPTRVYHIYVRAGAGAIAQYSLDGNVNDSAYLGDRHGTTHGSASYVSGPLGSALSLDGSGAHATAPNVVRTDASFSVSAWVKVNSVDDRWGTAVSQDGNATCGFCLRYEGEHRRWVFLMPQRDSTTDNEVVFVRSAEEPTPDAWTHLTGVHDAETRQVRLYVNGELQGTAQAGTTPWNAAGGVRIGQGKAGSGSDTWWDGGIDEVRMYDRALTDAEVRGEVRRDNVQAAHWRFEEDLATVARNSVTSGESAALSGGVAFFEQRAQPKDHALRFDGTGQARTTGPVVRTDKSFSVSAHVTLADTNGPMTVLSQDGPDSSGFVLQQRDGRWLFGMTEGNGSTAWNVVAQSATGTAVENTPTHLTAVFDSGTKKATLYVNGFEAAVSAVAGKPFWDSAGAFVLGNDQQGAALRGDLDNVRVYSRTLAADEVSDIVELDAGPVRQWRLDGDGVDTSGYDGGTAQLGSSVSWVSGQSENSDPKDLGVRLTGVPGASLESGHAVDTSRNFSVSAWAKLDKVVPGQSLAVLSQDGNTVSSFQLQATPDGHWAFAMFAADQQNGGSRHDRAIGAVAQQGVWTHLVGTYDAARDVMTLYINGVEAATAAHANAWNSTGAFLIGRAQWNGAQVDHFPGAIDDVEVHNRVLFADEIRDKAGRDLNLVHKWQFDEGTGTTAGDSVGGKAGTLTNATFAPGRLGNAVSFNGTNAEVSTGAVARTDENFTVSAWVKLPGGCATNCKRVAVSQDGQRNSKFRLGFLKDRDHLGNWVFEMTEEDTDATRVTVAAVSAEVDDFSGWVHLTGVYDRAAKQVLLYVEGNRVGEGVVNSTWQANGSVQIGRAKLRSAPDERWVGSIDDVRLYTGALDNEGVFALYRSYPSEDQPVATLPAADAGRWKLKEGTGTTAADSSGRNNTVTFSTGSGWIGGPTGGGTWLNGSGAAGETTGPVIDDTSRSYSVSAWAYAEHGITGNRAVLAQDGVHDSAFALSYNGDSGRWAVVQPDKDENGGTSTVLVSSEPAQTARWTHLTVVYDFEAKHLRLYVNGVLSAVKVGAVGWDADGPFTMGRSKSDGVKGSWWYRGIDDVRVFSRALTAGEVAKVHEDVPTREFGLYTFNDNNGNDTTWRRNTVTPSSGTSFAPGVFSSALKLDGTGSAAAQWLGVNTVDSFSVQAWARLDDDKRTSTVLSQDGNHVSGFVLQYRAESKRWAFAGHVQDSDSAPVVKALSAEQAVTGRWTHLAGVYNHAEGRMRLYVDGKLAGSEQFRMWNAEGVVAIGRAKQQGVDADRFAGLIDEVRVQQGLAAESRILANATRPLPVAGQLGRFVNDKGEHYTGPTGVAALPGYRFETPRGMTVPATDPNTVRLYSCKQGEDHFTATTVDCEGATLLGEIGAIYSVQPTNIPTIGLYRCFNGVQRFDSTAETCEGSIKQKQLGWVRAYTFLNRHNNQQFPSDHWSTPHTTAPGYRFEGTLGATLLIDIPGKTAALHICLDGADVYTSLDAACDGKTRLSGGGRVYTSPPEGVASKPLSRCRENNTTNRFDSTGTCEGHQLEQQLGYVVASVPTVAPTF